MDENKEQCTCFEYEGDNEDCPVHYQKTEEGEQA